MREVHECQNLDWLESELHSGLTHLIVSVNQESVHRYTHFRLDRSCVQREYYALLVGVYIVLICA